jgi:hypothetical protein
MRTIAIVALLLMAACTNGSGLSKPPDDAPVWNLNEGIQQGTNDLIQVPAWQGNTQ